MQWLISDLQKANKSADPEAIREALWNTSYSGITGEISFDSENGDANRSTAFSKKVDKDFGTWEFITVQSVD